MGQWQEEEPEFFALFLEAFNQIFDEWSPEEDVQALPAVHPPSAASALAAAAAAAGGTPTAFGSPSPHSPGVLRPIPSLPEEGFPEEEDGAPGAAQDESPPPKEAQPGAAEGPAQGSPVLGLAQGIQGCRIGHPTGVIMGLVQELKGAVKNILQGRHARRLVCQRGIFSFATRPSDTRSSIHLALYMCEPSNKR